jgi:hypothetical protein
MMGRLLSVTLIVLLLATAPYAVAAEAGKKSSKPIKLFGQIDELSYVCSSAGVKLSGTALPAKVAKISLGSAAAYSGLREGDTVLQARVGENGVALTIDRKGKKYEAAIATDVKGLRAEFESRKIPFSFGDSAFDKQLKTLGTCEIVLLLDHSASMGDTHIGVPGDLSKWVWTRQQLDNLLLCTDRVLDGGFTIVPFNSKFQIRKGVTLWDLKQTFRQLKPEGQGKNISAPIESVINDYFYARAHKGVTKPLVIVVLTDGTQNTGAPLQNVLIEASQKLNKPGEVVITFMQVGESILGEELFHDLDRNLVAKGAKYHMVDYKTFGELRNKGVVSELLETVELSAQTETGNAAMTKSKL